ncbi:MAG: Rpp14/Pop5 family protein [Candidatus Diapherotrites archaeon]|nr:hypothetical protein [Candidatus Micrarchaeota archaeon]MBU1939585.1 hypothetical protein [Candidatus Micrarchaeota archaeon]
MPAIKKRVKPIPLSMRGKKRYISFELHAERALRESDVSKALWDAMLSLYGSVGTARNKFWLMKWDARGNFGIVRCALGHEDEIKTGILFVKEVTGVSVLPKTLKTSGSISQLG